MNERIDHTDCLINAFNQIKINVKGIINCYKAENYNVCNKPDNIR